MLRITGILLVAFGIALPVGADSIIVDGQTLENVYIIETGSMYYVHFPDTGKVTGIPKAGVPRDAVLIAPDPAVRKSLRDQWNASSERLRPKPAQSTATEVPAPVPAKQPAPRKPEAPRLYIPAPGSQYATGGVVPHVKLEGVPLGRGLKAVLRPMNLDYKVEDGYLWISSPEKLRTESMEEPETRVYSLKNAGAETLPKVLVNNTAGAAQAAPIGGGNNFGGGGTAGFGGGVGGVGSGFGGGMGMGTAPTFSNISQLFGTIDDRSVGEPLAVIEMGNVTLQGRGNANYAAHNGLRSTQEPLYP